MLDAVASRWPKLNGLGQFGTRTRCCGSPSNMQVLSKVIMTDTHNHFGFQLDKRLQKDCKVIFTYDKLPYRELEAKNRSEYYSKKYKICFYTSEIQQKFFELLDHPCPKCDCPPYRTFQGLRNHVRKEHDHFYCDLCVENLKIFTFERRSYTQAELGSDQR
ncbi:uncharacterized protein isoform X2 [Musca autumnalis]|uniref:uncharacterized protein isoform X2 n=1 Tax=Musca autumnalis TaxID=221902 RepID=UPI003CF2E08C